MSIDEMHVRHIAFITLLFIVSAQAGGTDKCKHQCKEKSKWDTDDGPCIDLRTEPDVVSAHHKMITALREYYAYSEWKAIDWKAISDIALPDVLLANQTGDIGHLHVAVNKVIASVPDGHMENLFLDDDCGKNHTTEIESRVRHQHIGGSFGITVSPLNDDNGSVILTHVVPHSEADQQGLNIGDVVTHLNGVPIADAAKALGIRGWMWSQTGPEQGSENPGTSAGRVTQQYRYITQAPVGQISNWTVNDGNSSTVSLTAVDDHYATLNLTSPSRPFSDDGDNVKVHTKILDGGFGYLSLSAEILEFPKVKFAEAIKKLQHTPGMVIDIRGNDGGDDDQAADLNSHFMPASAGKIVYELVSFSNRLLSDIGQYSYMNGTNPDDYGIVPPAMIYSQPVTPHYSKPVVVLVNSNTVSTGEGIAMGFSKFPRSQAQIVGFDGTCGSFGMSGGTILLPGDFGLQFPFGRSLDANKQIQVDSDNTLKGGIVPTIPIPRTKSNVIEFVQGRLAGTSDIEVNYALGILKKMVSNFRQNSPS